MSPAASDSLTSTLRSRLLNFRLFEAAGMCDVIASQPELAPQRSVQWWKTLAQVARNYRALLAREAPLENGEVSGFTLGIELCREPAAADIAAEIERVAAEFRRWQTDVEGGAAYVAFVQGYTGFAELDDVRGPSHLARSLKITDTIFPLDEYHRRCVALLDGDARGMLVLDGPMSSYGAFQSTADYLQKVFNLPEHPLNDIRRFAIAPTAVA